jgi:DNA-binding CsgD family transcriptional regulator
LLIFPVAIATHLVCVAIPIDAGVAPPTAEEQLFVGAVARLATLLLRPRTPAGPSVSPSLSDSERAVLTLALEGLSEKQIALKLRRSPHTVHTHLRLIYRAYGVGSRAELLLLHLRGPD